jgi:outer membrane protein TolC
VTRTYDKFTNDVELVQAEAQRKRLQLPAQVESSLRTLYDNENELRLLMGLSATDGRLIRPKDDPTLARVEFDWTEILAESIARRPELIQQRWRVKQRELELILARNQLLPQLDVGAQYRWLGFGDDLIQATRNGVDFPGVGSTAFEELTGGKYQEFSLLFQYQMPIGFRRELAGVRHAQLRLAREKALLEDTELDISHGLSHSLRNLKRTSNLPRPTPTGGTRSAKWKHRRVIAVARIADLALKPALASGCPGCFLAGCYGISAIADSIRRKGSIMD